MVSVLISNTNPLFQTIQKTQLNPRSYVSLSSFKPISCSAFSSPNSSFRSPFIDYANNSTIFVGSDGRLINAILKSAEGSSFKRKLPIVGSPEENEQEEDKRNNKLGDRREVGRDEMLSLCGFGYWIQGFRCFPWLALNFHMAYNLQFQPSTLQLLQHSANLPMVAKPLYGVLSDAIPIGGAHRVPYISIGVILQVFSWGSLALIPFAGDSFGPLMACVLLSNLGAALTEVAQDALVAEYGQKNKILGLQSYTFMAIAVAGILGNSLGGIMLSKANPQIVLIVFSGLLLFQLSICLITREESIGLSKAPNFNQNENQSIMDSVKKQIRELLGALKAEKIARPMLWIVASIATVPILSGSIFCYQTQHLNLDPSIIGMSKVLGQVVLLLLTVLYDRFWKKMPMRNLISAVQTVYAFSFLLDLVLVKQMNLSLGISNELFALCFAGLAETIAVFKTVPFFVLIASLCPPGCEGSLPSFLASAMCLSSIVSGFFGIGLASLVGIGSGDYTNLPIGILIQFFAALLPLKWIENLPDLMPAMVRKEKKKGSNSRRSRRNRRVGRVGWNSILGYRRERGYQM